MLVLEHTVVVWVLCILTMAFCVIFCRMRGHPWRQWPLGCRIVSFSAMALLVTNWLVETPREQIVAECRHLARIADSGDINALEARLASDFHAGDLPRDEFLRRAAHQLGQTRLDYVRLRHIEVVLTGASQATVQLDATCNVRSASGFFPAVPTRWHLKFRREVRQWRLVGLDSVPVAPLYLRDPLP